MSRAGCRLLEVGTTNRTRLDDFAAEIDRASMLLKVHPSNAIILRDSLSPSKRQMATLATAHNIPSCVDLEQRQQLTKASGACPKSQRPKAYWSKA